MSFQTFFHSSNFDQGKFLETPLFSNFTKELKKIEGNNEKADYIFEFWADNRGTYANYFINLAKKMESEIKRSNDYYALGLYNLMLGWLIIDHYAINPDTSPKEAINYFLEAQRYFTLIDDKLSLIRALNGEASAHKQYSQYTESFDKYLLALDIAEKVKNEKLINTLMLNIGGLLLDLNQHKEALEYYEKSDVYMLSPQNEVAMQISNLSILYIQAGELDKAEKMALEALSLTEEGSATIEASLQLGVIKLMKKELDDAEKHLLKCLEAARQEQLSRLKAASLLHLGYIEIERGHFKKAQILVEESFEIAKTMEVRHTLRNAYLALAKIYRALNMYLEAYDMLEKGRELEQVIYNEEIVNKLSIMKIQQTRKENIIYKDLYNRISTISKIGQTITSNFDLRTIGHTMAEHIDSLMATDKLIIGSYNKKENILTYNMFVEGEDSILGYTTPIDKESILVKSCIEEQEGIVINNIDQENKEAVFNTAYRIVAKDTRSLMCVPLISNGQTIGFLAVQSKDMTNYTNYHLDILKALAAYTAIALENGQLFFDVKKLSLTDPLTALANRRYTFEMGAKEFARSKRYKMPLAVIIADIDYFKKINDSYGHASGDIVLKEVSKFFTNTIRGTDILGRIGGEEFLFILPNSEIEDALALAERLRLTIQNQEFKLSGNKTKITVSFGIAMVKKKDTTIDDTINRADEALYLAKNAGRNIVKHFI